MSTLTYDFSGAEKQLAALSNGLGRDVIRQVLTAGADVLVDKWRELGAKEGYTPPGKSGRATGAMLDAVAPSEISGNTISVYPRGKHGKKTRAAEVAYVLNYGYSSYRGTAWITDADDELTDAANAVMEEKLSEILSKL